MYVANQHAMKPDAALEVAREAGVGQFVSYGKNGLNATLLPFNVVTRDDGVVVLQAHFNKVNTQWEDEGDAMVIVQGPNAHVSALDMPPEQEGQKMPTVPTWNYVTVHLKGKFSVHTDNDWKIAHLTALVEQFEGEWRVGTHSSYELVNNALVAIVGVELEVSEIIGKAKLGQNLSPADVKYTAQHLRERDPKSASVADLMEEIALPWSEAREDRVTNAASTGKSTLRISGGLAN